MIQIEKNTNSNKWVVTLNEAVTIENPDFIWSLTSLASGATVAFYATDVSMATIRYNQFMIDEVGPTAIDLQAGKIHLADTGYWKYEVFQTGATVPHNLDLNDAQGLLESGMLLVTGPTSSDFNSLISGDADYIPVLED